MSFTTKMQPSLLSALLSHVGCWGGALPCISIQLARGNRASGGDGDPRGGKCNVSLAEIIIHAPWALACRQGDAGEYFRPEVEACHADQPVLCPLPARLKSEL
jgi:hypothetical protein